MKIIKLLFLLVLIMMDTQTYASDCAKHPLYCKILKLQPNIDHDWAMGFSNLINRASKRYGLDPMRIIAIANQESGIKNIDRCVNVIVFDEEKGSDHGVREWNVEQGCTDIGIFQLNVAIIQEYGFDIWKLKESVEYQVETHCKVLKDKIQMCKEYGVDAWTCYHTKTKGLREDYKRQVNRFY